MNKPLHPRLSDSWRLNMRKRLYKTEKRCRWCQTVFDEPIDYEGGEGRQYPRWTNGQLFPTLDHIVPLSEGGTNKRSNICLACEPCNAKRNN